MGYLLDTCLLSEVWKPAPNQGVIAWLGGSREDDLFLSVLSFGELKKGIEALDDGRRKKRFLRDYVLLRSRFSQRVLPVTEAVGERWGELSAAAQRRGRHLHVVDGLLAATAAVFGHTIVTRNTADFALAPVPLHDPWK